MKYDILSILSKKGPLLINCPAWDQKYMCNLAGCCNGKCVPALVGKILLIVGGINWGLVGVGMLMGSGDSWNVVHMALGSVSTLEAVVYILVGVAAVVKIFGCKCKKCMSACSSCGPDGKVSGSV